MAYFGKISTREHYGLRLAVWLAHSYREKKPITLSEISRHENISVKYLEQLIVPFRRAGWVRSQRGRDGGYQMKIDPNKLTLLDIINLITHKARVVSCLSSACPLEHRCPSKKAWQKVQQTLDRALQNITLSKLVA